MQKISGFFVRIRLVLILALGISHILVGQTGQVAIRGQTIDQLEQPVAGVNIKIESRSQAFSHIVKEAVSDKDGTFWVDIDLSAGEYLLSVHHDDFQEIKKENLFLQTGQNNLTIKLIPIERFSVDVSAEEDRDEINVEHVELSQTLTSKYVMDVPVTKADQFERIISSMQGVIRGPQEQLFFDGSPPDQNNYLLEGFNIADPITHRLEARVHVYAVDSFDRFSGRYSPEFGRGSGGTLSIFPKTGDNEFKHREADFFPGIDIQRGLDLTNWNPRIELSGPIIKNKVFFFNAFELNYSKNIIYDLPEEQKDRTVSWSGNNLFRIHANVAANNILTANFMANYLNFPFAGLSLVMPLETTVNNRAKLGFFSVKDQIFWPNASIDFGYAFYLSKSTETPQGRGMLVMTPVGNSGNFHVDSRQTGKRHQFSTNLSLPRFDFLGNHRPKGGANFEKLYNFQDVNRTGFEHHRLDGTLASRTVFGGNGKFGKGSFESAFYLQDEWALTSWLFAKGGIRWDRDDIISQSVVTPRISLALMPPGLKKTKLAAGWGLVPDTSYLRLFSRHLDQYGIITYFQKDGITLKDEPSLMILAVDPRGLKTPLTRNMSFGIEQKLLEGFILKANYLNKRTKDGYVFKVDNLLSASWTGTGEELPYHAFKTVFGLSNFRDLKYDSVTLALDKHFRNGMMFSGNYTWSRGLSNAATDISVDDPIIFSSRAGPLSWDIPHRFLGIGLIPITKNNLVSYFLEWRTGLPFTFHNEEGNQVGEFNANRMPNFFNLNLAFERRFNLFKKSWAIRIGVENVLNKQNSTMVNPNTSLPNSPMFFGIEPRKFVIRIRR